MAIYHCSVKIIGRNSGRSSVAAAAYRAAEKITNEYDGVEHDFTKKNWVEFKEILLPENAPSEYADRGTLWNAVEKSEKSKDAQLCREVELALPVEMTREQQIKVVEQFVMEELVSQGMIADIAVHNPPVTNDRHQPIDANGVVTKDTHMMQFRNPHAHILVTVRPLDTQGKWQHKSETEYLCRRGDAEKGFTAVEFRRAKVEGWQKQYKFLDGGKKVWLTATEGKERGLERINRSPKTTPYGRKNETVEYWNDKERIFEWRQSWEKIVNDEFIRLQCEVRIDHRSFRDQGREEELPTLHLGPSAVNMERRAERELHEGKPADEVVHSDIGGINKLIREHNQLVRAAKARLKALTKKTKDRILAAAKKLESLRAQIILAYYQKGKLSRDLRTILLRLRPVQDRLERYRSADKMIKKESRAAARQIRELENRASAPEKASYKKKIVWQEEIRKLQGQLEAYGEYMANVAKMCGFDSEEDYQAENTYCADGEKDCRKLQKAIEKLQMEIEGLISKYKTEYASVGSDDFGAIDRKRRELREKMEGTVKAMLQDKYGRAFDEENYLEAERMTDKLLEPVNGEKNVRGSAMTKEYPRKGEETITENLVHRHHCRS